MDSVIQQIRNLNNLNERKKIIHTTKQILYDFSMSLPKINQKIKRKIK